MKAISLLILPVEISKQIYFENKLSKREQEVVKYLISGAKTSKIARDLGVKATRYLQ